MKTNKTLTFAEKKVNFRSLDRFGRDLSLLLDMKIKKLIPNLAQQKNTKTTIESMINIVTLIQKEAFEVGKKSAATEMKVKVPPTNISTIDIMKENNRKVIQKIVDDIQKRLTEKWFSEQGVVSQFTNGLKTLYVYGSINMGREVIFEKYPELIYAFQYSAILDGRTTPLCQSLEDMIVTADDPRRAIYTPPNHWNCRSIWVEILQEETHKPKLQSKTPEDIELMKKYKTNAVDVWIVAITKQVIQEELIKKNKNFF